MKFTTTHAESVATITIEEERLTFPALPELASAAADLIAAGHAGIVIDLSAVRYLDSAAIGCLMDVYRQATAAGGTLKLSGVQKRVETMLTMAGAHHFIEVHPDARSAQASFRS